MSPLRYIVVGALACALALILMVSAKKAFAQVSCGEAGRLTTFLAGKGLKVTADLTLKTESAPVPMRIFVNPKTGVTFPGPEVACIVLVGDKFELARLPGSDA